MLARLHELGVDTQHWNRSVFAFRAAAASFDLRAAAAESTSPLQLRAINDQKRGFERTLLGIK